MLQAPPLEFWRAVPRAPLAAFVECVWAVRGAGGYRRAQVLPNGALQLMLNFGAPHHVLAFGAREQRQQHRRAWIAGLQDEPLAIEAPEVSDLLAIRFRPGGAHAFLGLPLDALTNQVVDADALLGAALATLHEPLAEAPDRSAQLRLVEDWLLARLAPREPEQALVARAIAALAVPPGTSVHETCERLGLSNRHLIALFRRHVGLPPKTLARVLRFHAALRQLPRAASRTELALALGYADQAHFNHEFRRFAGLSPGRYAARRGDDDESVILP